MNCHCIIVIVAITKYYLLPIHLRIHHCLVVYLKIVILNSSSFILGPKFKIEEGGIVQGYIFSKNPGLGINVKMYNGLMARVALCDMLDKYVDCPTEKYRKGQCVRCYILQHGGTNKETALSLRKSR